MTYTINGTKAYAMERHTGIRKAFHSIRKLTTRNIVGATISVQ